MRQQAWQLEAADERVCIELSRSLKVSELTARVLVNRGYRDERRARFFLHPQWQHLQDPYLLPDVKTAVNRLERAREQQEKVTVYGDFDADGMSGTAMMVAALEDLGLQASYYIPRRLEDGFGLHSHAVREIAGGGCTLLVTVDCGTSDADAVDEAGRLGMDVIITDHHQPDCRLPRAVSVVNPCRQDSHYPEPHPAGIGVAFQLLRALARELGREDDWGRHYLDLVALGTLADVVCLQGDNRVLARLGLEQMRFGSRLGLIALSEVAGINLKEVEEGHIGFGLAPRLNACGRLGSAGRGVELLLARDTDRALLLARELDDENRQRRELESQVLDQAREYLQRYPGQAQAPVLVLAEEGWHQGVLGIAASRLAEDYGRPAFLVGWGPEGVGRGSARGFPGFHVQQALENCEEYLLSGGGHEQAGGFSLTRRDFPAFRERLWQLGEQMGLDAKPALPLRAEGVLSLQGMSSEMARELRGLAPFGPGNPEPLWVSSGARVLEKRRVGQDKRHLKLTVWEEKHELGAIGFGLGSDMDQVPLGGAVDLLFSLGSDCWQGRERVQLYLKDWKRAQPAAGATTGAGACNLLDYRHAETEKAPGQVLDAPALLYVSSGQEARDWSLSLGRHLDGRVEALHGDMDPANRRAVERRFILGRTEFLVATSTLGLAELPPHVRRLVWLHPTPKPEEFLRLSHLLPPDLECEIALVYGEATVRRVRRLVESRLPDRTLVDAAWRLLEQRPLAAGVMDVSQVRQELSSAAGVLAPLPAVRRTLEILEEMGLVQERSGKTGAGWIRVENGSWSRQPEETECYSQIVKQKQDYMDFLAFLSRAPVSEVARFIRGELTFPQAKEEACRWS